MTGEDLISYRLDELRKDVEKMAAHLEALENRQAAAELKASERERKQLQWGIGALGTAVIVLASLVWSHLPGILGRK